jgi:[ribosomal protein S5]-alanine N-acetyltransferase
MVFKSSFGHNNSTMFYIQTPRTQIQPLTAEDFRLLLPLMQHPDVMRYIGTGVKTELEARELFNLLVAHQDKFEFSLGKVFDKQTKRFIGIGGVVHFALDYQNPVIEVGYWLHPEFWGKGYATEIAKGCIDWAFQNLNIDKIVGVTDPANTASQNVLIKAGLSPRGTTQYIKDRIVSLFERSAPEQTTLFRDPPANFAPAVEIAACYVLAENEILLLKRSYGKREEGLWGVPAGKIEPEETPIEGAVRELYEETGLQISPLQLVDKGKRFIRKSSIDYIYHMFILPLEKKPCVGINDEHLQYCWITPREAETLPLMAGAKEALTAAGVTNEN